MNTFDLAVCSLPGNRCRKRRSLAADLGKQFVLVIANHFYCAQLSVRRNSQESRNSRYLCALHGARATVVSHAVVCVIRYSSDNSVLAFRF